MSQGRNGSQEFLAVMLKHAATVRAKKRYPEPSHSTYAVKIGIIKAIQHPIILIFQYDTILRTLYLARNLQANK